MSNRRKIEKACRQNGLEIVALSYERQSTPTPGGCVAVGWMLTVRHDGDEDQFVGDCEEIVGEIEEFWEDGIPS